MDENVKKKIKKFALFSSIGCGPLFLMMFCLFFVVFFVLGLFDSQAGGSSGSSACVNLPTVDSICKSITVSGYGTMSVDEYVAGVVENEFGSADLETKKAQAVAARSYGLAGATKDGNGNCVISNTSEGFQTYNSSPSESSIQAANETSGIILLDENANVARAEYSSNSLPQPYSSYSSMVTMSERNLEIPKDWWARNKTCSDSRLNMLHVQSNGVVEKDAYGRDVYGCGHGRGMGQIAAKYLSQEKGYTYDQILDFFYGSESEYNWSLASTNSSSSNCDSATNNGNLQTLSSYTLKHDGLNVLNRTLTSSEIKEMNAYINENVDEAGYGTGVGVVAAGQSLVYALQQKGYYLQYYWGGDRYSVGVGSRWGANVGITYTDGGNPTGPEFGMDCSGFVSWSIRNGCNTGFGGPIASEFMGYGSEISLSDAKPGDVIASSGHVMLIVKNNGDNTVTIAEETYSSGNGGLWFNIKSASEVSGYKVVSMSNWYKNNCSKSR